MTMNPEAAPTTYPSNTSTQEIPSFGPASGISPGLAREKNYQFSALIIAILFIILIFSLIKNYRIAWLVATIFAPFVSIIFLSLFYNFLSLYYFYGLVYFLVGSGIVSALIGFMVYLWRRYR